MNGRPSKSTRHGSFLQGGAAGGGGGSSGYRSIAGGQGRQQGLDLKASILSNMQNEKANKRREKRQLRRTIG